MTIDVATGITPRRHRDHRDYSIICNFSTSGRVGIGFTPPVRLAALITEAWILNPLGCGYRAGLESAMGEKRGALRVAVDAYGSEFQLRLIASGLGLGLVPRSVLRASTHRDDISTVDVTDFSLKLDIWLVHLADFGNLLGPVEAFEKAVAEGFVRYEPEKGDTPTVLSQAS
jgi:DNA-binding transcriptional LysR family regulator